MAERVNGILKRNTDWASLQTLRLRVKNNSLLLPQKKARTFADASAPATSPGGGCAFRPAYAGTGFRPGQRADIRRAR
jgi:hypothetical protein